MFSLTPLEDALPLSAVPLPVARPAIRAALVSFARRQALEAWSTAAQERALARIACQRDDLPAVSTVDLSAYLPVVSLDG
ncbi:MAG: hypothetical protein C4306_01665 [Thermoleophilia bacterium]